MDINIEIEDKLYEANVYRKEQEYDLAVEKYIELYQIVKKSTQWYQQYGCEVLKQLCFCYRKKRNTNAAVDSINEAIRLAGKNSLKYESNEAARSNLAICYMNKGVIYDEIGDFDVAIENYNMGVSILRELVAYNGTQMNLLINALLNLGTAYFNNKEYDISKRTFHELLDCLGDNREVDSRGMYAMDYIEKIKRIEG